MVPLQHRFLGDSTLTATATPGVYIQNLSGDGDDVTYGAFTPTGTSTIDFSNPPVITITDGTFLETFTLGTLFGTDSGSGTASGKGTATLTVDFVFTGGTGIFAGATGEAVATINVTATSPTTESETGTYVGMLSLAAPGSLMLLASAVAVIFRLRRRWTAAG